MLKKTSNQPIEVYIDAKMAGYPINGRSTSKYCSFVCGNLVTWKAKKQQVIAWSSAEVEF